MPNQQQSSSSAQASTNGSDTPKWDYKKPREGRVASDAYEYDPAISGYILISPCDELGALNNEKGIPTKLLKVAGEMLDDAMADNYKQAKDKANEQGQELHDKEDDKKYRLIMNDRVYLDYSSALRLIGIRKIN